MVGLRRLRRLVPDCRLGRKRLLDTLLGATYWSVGIRSLATLNRADFEVFDRFAIVEP